MGVLNLFEEGAIQKVFVEAEDCRDAAWGIAELGEKCQLVLEMQDGYSWLYVRRNCGPECRKRWMELSSSNVKMLSEEQPNWKEANEIASIYNVEFIHKN